MKQKQLFKGRDKRKRGWFWLDNDYLNGYGKVFGPVGVAIYVSLCRHVDNKTQKCFPAQETIAGELKITSRTVRKYLALFQKYHIVSISKERDIITKKWLNNVYTLLDKDEWIKPEETISDGKPEETNSTKKPKARGTQRPNKETNIYINKTHLGLEKPTTPISIKRKSKKFPKAWLNQICEAYQDLRGIELQGNEWLPVQQTIKTMFLSGRSVENIIGCMEWLAEGSEEWMENWTIRTVKMKLPFYLATVNIVKSKTYFKSYD